MLSISFQMFCITVICIALSASQLLTRADLIAEQQRYGSPVVQTNSGAVVGKTETLPHGKSVFEYLGIPYAEPPIGELRFAAPKPAKPWSGTKDAKEFGAECPQPLTRLVDEKKSGRMSEDCLFLNVFVPSTIKTDDNKAIMVWIHGGRFAFGSSSRYPGGVLSAFNDVIVVSINYRLGILGFFNFPGTDVKGNYGILDQVLALKWVQANIANFGGDPNRVTVFGQSAGAMSISLHLISPLAKGLFHRAIMQSGGSSTPLYNGKVTNTKQLELFAKLVNCSVGPSLIKCLRGKPVEDILTVQRVFMLENYTAGSTQDIVGPVVDGELLPDLPENLFKTGKFHVDVDVMTGVTSHEGAVFGFFRPPDEFQDGLERDMFERIIKGQMLYVRETSSIVEDLVLFEYTNHGDPDNKNSTRQSLFEAFGDAAFVSPVLRESKALAMGGRLPFVYVFNHRAVYSPLPKWIGAIHCMDIPFVFGAPFRNIPDPIMNILTTKYSETEKGLSLYIMKLWTTFAKYGSPNPPPECVPMPVTWPKFTEQEQAYLFLDLKPMVGQMYRARKMAFWHEIIPKLTAG